MPQARSARRRGWATAGGCAALIATAAALSATAARTKSATADDPTHLVAGWRSLWDGDYRLDVANPPLWKMWAALGSPATTLRLPTAGPLARPVAFAPDDEPLASTRVLFDTPGTDGRRVVEHGRAMMLVVAVALLAAVAARAYRLAGPAAAVVATALLAFDPTVLAHASVVKGDLMLGLALVGLTGLATRAGRRATVAAAVGLGVVCAAAVQAKFSGLLAGPMLALLLLLRVLTPTPWPALGRVARSWPARLAVAATVGLVAAAVTVTLTWGCYRFRYRPTPSPTAGVDMAAVYDRSARAGASAALGRPATPAEVAARPPTRLVRFVRWADGRRLLPQAFGAGLVAQATAVSIWPGYLDGHVYYDGRAAYFPLALLYKTPVAELAALALAAAGVAAVRRAGWAGACIAVPAVVFGLSALAAHVNIGLRTLLPLYPLVAIAAGCSAAWAYRRRPRLTLILCVTLLGCEAVTAAAAWPDYLPFFNAAIGGPEAGLAHLGDSNLDWGQDVPALADWARRHPDRPVYADLFLAVDPAVYGLRVHWLWTPDASGRMRPRLPDRPAVIAVSATQLQGLYVDPAHRRFLAEQVVRRPPVSVLHGTIYLYDYRP